MFLNDILDKAYLTEMPPTPDEILLMPAGFKTGIDHNMVVPRSVFESVMVQFRATEPASEAILMAIGKAKDNSDPVWSTLLTNECVVSRYTELSNTFYAEQLQRLEGQNAPVDVGGAGSRLASMTRTPGQFVDSGSLVGRNTQFVPPQEEPEDEETAPVEGVGDTASTGSVAEEEATTSGEDVQEEPHIKVEDEVVEEAPNLVPPAEGLNFAAPEERPVVLQGSNLAGIIGCEESEEPAAFGGPMFGLPPCDVPDFGQTGASEPAFGVPPTGTEVLGFEQPESPVFCSPPASEPEVGEAEAEEAASSLAGLMREVAGSAPAVPAEQSILGEDNPIFTPPAPEGEGVTEFVPPAPGQGEENEVVAFVPPAQEEVAEFVPPASELEPETATEPEPEPEVEQSLGEEAPAFTQSGGDAGANPTPPVGESEASEPEVKEEEISEEEKEARAVQRLKAMSSATDIFADAERLFHQYGLCHICATCNISPALFMQELTAGATAMEGASPDYTLYSDEQVNQAVFSVLGNVKQVAFALIEEERYAEVQEVLAPVMRLIYEE